VAYVGMMVAVVVHETVERIGSVAHRIWGPFGAPKDGMPLDVYVVSWSNARVL
jgi:hypothetical protein